MWYAPHQSYPQNRFRVYGMPADAWAACHEGVPFLCVSFLSTDLGSSPVKSDRCCAAARATREVGFALCGWSCNGQFCVRANFVCQCATLGVMWCAVCQLVAAGTTGRMSACMDCHDSCITTVPFGCSPQTDLKSSGIKAWIRAACFSRCHPGTRMLVPNHTPMYASPTETELWSLGPPLRQPQRRLGLCSTSLLTHQCRKLMAAMLLLRCLQ